MNVAVREYRLATGPADRDKASDKIVDALDRLVPGEVVA